MGRGLGISGGALALVTLGIGALHTPYGLALMGAECPFGQARDLSPEEREQARLRATRRLRVGVAAAERPVPIFWGAAKVELGVTLRRTLVAQFAERGGRCTEGRTADTLRCEWGDEPTRAIAADFDPEGRVVALTDMTYHERLDAAERAFSDRREVLEDAVGAADRVGGVERLTASRFAQKRREFQRDDYLASVSATTLGPSRYLVTGVYRALD